MTAKRTTNKKDATTKRNLYDEVTQAIIDKLESGVIPWQRPWKLTLQDVAFNRISKKPYSLLNQLHLGQPGEYATFKQWQELGGRVKKGEKAHAVVFWKLLGFSETSENDAGESETSIRTVPVLRYFNVFHISQVEGVEPLSINETAEPIVKIPEAETLMHNYLQRENIPLTQKGNSAYYRPLTDEIVLPKFEQFKSASGFYATAFHEMTHSTGHETRLGRFGKSEPAAAFGSKSYSKEELVAEFGSAMLLGYTGLFDEAELDNSASYIDGWSKALKDDNKLLIGAASRAEKAVNFILGFNPWEKHEDETKTDTTETVTHDTAETTSDTTTAVVEATTDTTETVTDTVAETAAETVAETVAETTEIDVKNERDTTMLIPEGSKKVFSIALKELNGLYKKLKPAMAKKKDSYPVLFGLRIAFHDDKAYAESCEGHEIFRVILPEDTSFTPEEDFKEFLIPRALLDKLAKFKGKPFDGTKAEVYIYGTYCIAAVQTCNGQKIVEDEYYSGRGFDTDKILDGMHFTTMSFQNNYRCDFKALAKELAAYKLPPLGKLPLAMVKIYQDGHMDLKLPDFDDPFRLETEMQLADGANPFEDDYKSGAIALNARMLKDFAAFVGAKDSVSIHSSKSGLFLENEKLKAFSLPVTQNTQK